MKKIAIIGGGPAGLQAALFAAESGLDVHLFEKDKLADNQRKADLYFDIMGMVSKPNTGVRYRVNQISVDYKRQKNLINSEKLSMLIIDRKEWLLNMRDQAVELGVEIDEGFEITTDNLSELKSTFDYIIDASGVPSVTSSLYGFENIYMKDALLTVEYIAKGNFSDYNNSIAIIPGENDYRWIYPYNEEKATIGLGSYTNSISQVKNLNGKLDRDIKNYDLAEEVLHKYIRISPTVVPRRLTFDNIILIGNAAGLSSPLYGSGLDLAQLSARIAVEEILKGTMAYYQNKLVKKIAVKYLFEQKIRELCFV
ncbi:MAG: NAD(P)/FAD-dependent oxidoreductase, partial [Halanaerobiales bacterium]